MGQLEGKVALVTGASRGIGKAIARLFAREGARVVCVARSLREGDHKQLSGSLTTTVSEIEAAGGLALAMRANLAREEECVRAVAQAKEAFGAVDLLVNDAAVTYFLPLKDTTIQQWDLSWAVGMRGAFIMTKLVLPDMIEKHAGAIVNVSSFSAVGPGRGPYQGPFSANPYTMYGAEKAALERFTQGLAEEVYQYGITVAAVAPSHLVVTPGTIFFGQTPGPGDPNAESPELMARATLILATEPLSKVTGRVTYSQMILKEYGLRNDATGYGVDPPGSGYSKM